VLSFAQFEPRGKRGSGPDNSPPPTQRIVDGWCVHWELTFRDRRIVIDERRPETVRYIFRRYLGTRMCPVLKEDLDRSRGRSSGNLKGPEPSMAGLAPRGVPFRGSSRIPIYVLGRSRHRTDLVSPVSISDRGIERCLWSEQQQIRSTEFDQSREQAEKSSHSSGACRREWRGLTPLVTHEKEEEMYRY